MQDKKVSLPEELSKLRSQSDANEEGEEGKDEEEQFDAKVHYDKEDLISFH